MNVFLITKRKLSKGFTLIETILSIALIGALAGIAAPIFQSLQVKNDLDIGANTITRSLRRAQILSMAGDGDSNWGVGVQNGSVVLYKGSNYSERDTNYDESFEIAGSVTASGLSEVSYAKFTGLPSGVGSITLSSSRGDTKTITINEKGIPNY